MDERRNAERVVPKRKLKGKMQLQAAGQWVAVRAVMDVSPFGIRVRLEKDIRTSGEVVLRLENGQDRLETEGSVAWLVAGAGRSCMAGIALLPENVLANTRFFDAIIGGG